MTDKLAALKRAVEQKLQQMEGAEAHESTAGMSGVWAERATLKWVLDQIEQIDSREVT